MLNLKAEQVYGKKDGYKQADLALKQFYASNTYIKALTSQ
jgi:hypothetical protein